MINLNNFGWDIRGQILARQRTAKTLTTAILENGYFSKQTIKFPLPNVLPFFSSVCGSLHEHVYEFSQWIHEPPLRHPVRKQPWKLKKFEAKNFTTLIYGCDSFKVLISSLQTNPSFKSTHQWSHIFPAIVTSFSTWRI